MYIYYFTNDRKLNHDQHFTDATKWLPVPESLRPDFVRDFGVLPNFSV
jgi:hypothetical protein